MSNRFEIALFSLSGGKESPLKGAYSLLNCAVSNSLNKLPRAVITLLEMDANSSEFMITTANDLKVGCVLVIKVSYLDKAPAKLITGVIEKQTLQSDYAGTTVSLELRHPAVRMTRQLNTRVFPPKSTEFSAVKGLLTDWGKDAVKPKIAAATPDLPKVPFDNLVQFESTDWDFICWRAAVNGRLVSIGKNSMIEVILPALGAPSLTLSSDEDQILEYEITTDGTAYADSATSITQDVKPAKTVVKKKVLKSSKMSDRSAIAPTLGDVSGGAKIDYFQSIPGEDKEANTYTEAMLLRSDLSVLQGRVSLIGDSRHAALFPGQTINLKKLGNLVNAEVIVSAISHRMGDAGWIVDIHFGVDKTLFQHQRQLTPNPALGLLPPVSGLQLAEVVDTKEAPDEDARILVQILNQNEPKIGAKSAVKTTFLARLLSLYAGEKRGAWFRPEKGDLVLLGFLNDDPRQPIILGSLYRSKKSIPELLKSDPKNMLKGLLFDEEMGITCDSVKKVITLSTQVKGKLQSIILDHGEGEGSVTIDHAGKHTIKITNEGIDIKTSGNITTNADGDISFTAKGKVEITGKEINLKN
ncbi:MAG: type VI secretion system tip protein VgrG [Bacteroidota bacterium]